MTVGKGEIIEQSANFTTISADDKTLYHTQRDGAFLAHLTKKGERMRSPCLIWPKYILGMFKFRIH